MYFPKYLVEVLILMVMSNENANIVLTDIWGMLFHAYIYMKL